MSSLTKVAERVAAEAVAAAFANGQLEILDDAGAVLARLDIPSTHSFDLATGVVSFEAPKVGSVQKMGNPASFRVVSKAVGGAALLEGSAADLHMKQKRLFVGQKISVDGLEYQLRFGGAK